MSTPAVEIRNLVKRYGTFEAVRGISLTVPSGQFLGLLGPNGAGKTSIINVLTGLANRTSGDVLVFGKDVDRDYIECRKRIGLAEQEYNFDRFFPIRKILEFEGGYFGLSTQDARTRSEELLKRFGLWDKRDARAPKLSGGMKRRLFLAKALIHEPDILILDEPTAGLDVELRLELWQHLRDLNRLGKTIILTTHYLEEAEELCEEVAIMHRGKIEEKGRVDELKKKKQKSLQEIFIDIIQQRPEEGEGIK